VKLTLETGGKEMERSTLLSIPHTLYRMVFLAVLFCFVGVPALAQFDSATVLGTIRDASGAALPNANVTIRNLATGISMTVQADAGGDFLFPNVRAGSYRISAELQGFSTAIVEQVIVAVNARQRVDLVMTPGTVTESIVITDAAQLLETDSSVRGQVVQRDQIVSMKLKGL
jgi:hypothetical protein